MTRPLRFVSFCSTSFCSFPYRGMYSHHPLLQSRSPSHQKMLNLSLLYILKKGLSGWVVLQPLLDVLSPWTLGSADDCTFHLSTKSGSHRDGFSRLVLQHIVEFCKEVLPMSLLQAQLLLCLKVTRGYIIRPYDEPQSRGSVSMYEGNATVISFSQTLYCHTVSFNFFDSNATRCPSCINTPPIE